MRIKISSLGALCSVILLACGGLGCSTASHLRTDDYDRAPASTASSEGVKVYSTYNIGRAYRSLGIVISSADSGGDAEGAVSELKAQAAQLGADAIVGLSLEVNQGFWEAAVRATGVAVQY